MKVSNADLARKFSTVNDFSANDVLGHDIPGRDISVLVSADDFSSDDISADDISADDMTVCESTEEAMVAEGAKSPVKIENGRKTKTSKQIYPIDHSWS